MGPSRTYRKKLLCSPAATPLETASDSVLSTQHRWTFDSFGLMVYLSPTRTKGVRRRLLAAMV